MSGTPARPAVTVAVCTRDRAASLARTLEGVRRLAGFDGREIEVVVVDNGSFDATPDVLAAQARWLRPVRCDRPGLSAARNDAVRAARGEVVLFTDDDIAVPPTLARDMAAPILAGACDATQGAIELAADLRRAWMGKLHRAMLACVEPPADAPKSREPETLVGACMAVRRSMIVAAGGFDEEIGPGVLGGGDDTIFSHRLRAAGGRLRYAARGRVVHHPGEHRLARASFRRAAWGLGLSNAYISRHLGLRSGGRRQWPQAAWLAAKLAVRSPTHLATDHDPEWRLYYLMRMSEAMCTAGPAADREVKVVPEPRCLAGGAA